MEEDKGSSWFTYMNLIDDNSKYYTSPSPYLYMSLCSLLAKKKYNEDANIKIAGGQHGTAEDLCKKFEEYFPITSILVDKEG